MRSPQEGQKGYILIRADRIFIQIWYAYVEYFILVQMATIKLITRCHSSFSGSPESSGRVLGKQFSGETKAGNRRNHMLAAPAPGTPRVPNQPLDQPPPMSIAARRNSFWLAGKVKLNFLAFFCAQNSFISAGW